MLWLGDKREKDGLWLITDTTDGVAEYYSYEQVVSFVKNSGLVINGVTMGVSAYRFTPYSFRHLEWLREELKNANMDKAMIFRVSKSDFSVRCKWGRWKRMSMPVGGAREDHYILRGEDCQRLQMICNRFKDEFGYCMNFSIAEDNSCELKFYAFSDED